MSNQQVATTEQKPVRLIDEWRNDVHRMEGQFKMALPAHIPVERFVRVVLTALQNNPKLMACTKQSFFNAAVKCAQDGLLPDGREAAIVPFGEEDDGGGGGRTRGDLAGYMPMVHGIRKKVRNSGEIADLHAHAVHEGDQFDYQLGDEPYILHKPGPGGRTRPITHVYSVAVFKDGTRSRDVMPIAEVEEIRKKFSRSRKGPWSVPESYQEMAIKTVVKHHAKSLPMSTDLDRLMHADDDLYDFKGAKDEREPVKPAERPKSIAHAFDVFAADEQDDTESVDDSAVKSSTTAGGQLSAESSSDSVEKTDQEHPAPADGTQGAPDGAAATTSHGTGAAAAQQFVDPIKAAEQRGREDRARGMSNKACPPEWREKDKTALAAAWLKGWNAAEQESKGGDK